MHGVSQLTDKELRHRLQSICNATEAKKALRRAIQDGRIPVTPTNRTSHTCDVVYGAPLLAPWARRPETPARRTIAVARGAGASAYTAAVARPSGPRFTGG